MEYVAGNQEHLGGLVQVSTAKREDLPLSPNSIYKFHSTKKYPHIILKVCGKLYFDTNAWWREVEAVRKAQVTQAESLRRGVM